MMYIQHRNAAFCLPACIPTLPPSTTAHFLWSSPVYVDGSVNIFPCVWFEPGASTGWIYTGTNEGTFIALWYKSDLFLAVVVLFPLSV